MGSNSSKQLCPTHVKLTELPPPNAAPKPLNTSSSTGQFATKAEVKAVGTCGTKKCEPPYGYTDVRKQGDVDYEMLVEKLNVQKNLWTDEEFPPDSKSVGSVSLPYETQWRRPKEIDPKAALFVNGMSRFDINQGALGDCWLLAVLADAVMNRCMISFIVPRQVKIQEKRYCGVFRAFFWCFGKWTQVIVDDNLLTTKDGKLVFTSSTARNEMWPALLEKAYAKLHTNYEALTGGLMIEAMEDLTGGLGEMILMAGQTPLKELGRRILWYQHRCCLMACGSLTDKYPRNGLVQGHAYSITGATKVKVDGQKIILVRLRNPWGNYAEWTGSWSDKSREWEKVSPKVKKRLHLTFRDDGEFWMSLKDMSSYFVFFNVCHVTFETLLRDESAKGKLSMKETVLYGEWIGESAAGSPSSVGKNFLKNPQFLIQLQVDGFSAKKRSTVFFSLMQDDRRRKFCEIGFRVYQVPEDLTRVMEESHLKKDVKKVLQSEMLPFRSVVASKSLGTGAYIMIPYTNVKGIEKRFMIRIFTEAKFV